MLQIVHASTDEHVQAVRELFGEYLHWGGSMIQREFAITLDIGAMLEADMRTLSKFDPPWGRLLIARAGTHLAGMACLKRLTDDTGEVKRMYVRPQFRRMGIGQTLLAELLTQARAIGYHHARLDSARFMHAAHALYRSLGFQEIAPYCESEVPAEFHQYWIFMEKALEKQTDALPRPV